MLARTVLLLCVTGAQCFQTRIIYDNFFKHSVQSQWKSPLDLFLRQMVLRHLTIGNLARLHTNLGGIVLKDDNATVTLTSCNTAKWLTGNLNSDAAFRIDLMPCGKTKGRCVPLTWAQENVFCLFSQYWMWIGAIETKSLQSTLGSSELKENTGMIEKLAGCSYNPLKSWHSNQRRRLDSSKLHARDRAVKMAVINVPPACFVQVAANGSVIRFTGYARKIADLMLGYLNATMIPVTPKDRSLGLYENGSWTGIVNMVLNEECDIGAAPFYLTQDRFKVIRYSTHLIEDVNTIVIRAPQEDVKLWIVVQIFNWQVWLVLLGTMGVLCSTFWLYLKASGTQPNKLATHLLYSIRILIAQGEDLQGTMLSIRLLAATWCFASLILVNVYTSTLMSSLIVPILRPAIDSLQDLAFHSDLQPFAKRGTSWETMILNPEMEAMTVIAQKFRTNPADSWVDTFEEGISRIMKGGSAFLSTESIIDFYRGVDFDTYKRCRLYQTKYDFQHRFSAGILPIATPSNDAFNYALSLVHEHGFTVYLSAPSLSARRVKHVCGTSLNQVSTAKELGLPDFLSAFLIFFLGILVACLALLWENLRKFLTPRLTTP